MNALVASALELRLRAAAVLAQRMDVRFRLTIPIDAGDDEWAVQVDALPGRPPVECVGASLDETVRLTLSYLECLLHDAGEAPR